MSRFPVVNVTTNLVFILLGAIGGLIAGAPWGILFAVAMIVLGVGSGLWHMYPKNDDLRLLDEIGMYFVASVLAVLWTGLPWWLTFLPWAAAAYLAKKHLDSMVVIPLFIAVILGAMLGAGNWWAVGCGALFGAAFWARQRDPVHHEGDFWGGLWHFLTGFAVFLSFVTYPHFTITTP